MFLCSRNHFGSRAFASAGMLVFQALEHILFSLVYRESSTGISSLRIFCLTLRVMSS